MPALRRLLSRAHVERLPIGNFENTVCRLFGLTPQPNQDLPLASLRRFGEAGSAEGYWLCADPVHLRADLHQVLLVAAAEELSIEPDEATQLAEQFNTTLGADGLSLDTPQPHHWYLRLDQPPRITTTPIAEARGHNINRLLPKGTDARRWHALLTEFQMLLHASAVNAAREAAGRPAINGVWLWGGGVLPSQLVAPAAECCGTGPLLRGLSRRAGLALQAPPANADDWQSGDPAGSQLIVLEQGRALAAGGDFNAWGQWLETLEHDWLAPLERLLRRGRLASLALYPCDRLIFRVNRRRLARVWRRPRPLAEYLRPS